MTKLQVALKYAEELPLEEQDFLADWIVSFGDTSEVYELSDEEVAELKQRQVSTQKTYSMEEVFGSL